MRVLPAWMIFALVHEANADGEVDIIDIIHKKTCYVLEEHY